MAVLGIGITPTSAHQPAPLACTACLVLEIDAANVEPFVTRAGDLTNLAIYVRGSDRKAAVVAAERILAAGGESGVILDATPGESSEFQMRTEITDLRGSSRSIRIVIDLDSLLAAGIDPSRVAPYADVTAAASAAIGQWRRLPMLQRPSVAALAAASMTGGTERVLLPVRDVEPSVLREFARLTLIGSAVQESRQLTAQEIVARHQAQQRQQGGRVRTSIAEGITAVTFEVPGMTAPVVITASTVIYRNGSTVDIEQKDIRVNGAAIGGGSADRPPQLPLLEPERAATAPLVIALTDAYRYVRVADDRIDGAPSLAVEFTPAVAGRTLPTGTAILDPGSFALRRVERTQQGLRPPIVSSHQVEEFAEYESGVGPVSLPWRTRIYEIYDGAGHRTPVRRQLTVERYLLNAPEFADRLASAHASANVMLRETPDGLRYLVREAGGARAVLADASPPVRAIVFGLVIDPNITRPLPFAGLSYLDLDWLGRGQLNAFVGPTYGQLSWSMSPRPASRWVVEGSAFAIAVPYNDRVFREGREQYAENLEQRPVRASIGVAGPASRGLRVRGIYSIDVTRFERTDSTAADFRVPSTGIVHGMTIALDAARGPWSGRVWWTPSWRHGWREWGRTVAAPVAAFQRGGLRASRTLVLGKRVSAGIAGEWVVGRRLDRFSLFAVDGFENRLHGYPTASIRYDRGLIVRSTAGWSAAGWRVNGFADMAAVRDAGFGRQVRTYPGIGAAVEAGGPLRMLWSLEWGYGPRAVASDGGIGTQSWRITGYRPF